MATCSVLDEENAPAPAAAFCHGCTETVEASDFENHAGLLSPDKAQQVRFFCEKFGLYLSHPPLHAR